MLPPNAPVPSASGAPPAWLKPPTRRLAPRKSHPANLTQQISPSKISPSRSHPSCIPHRCLFGHHQAPFPLCFSPCLTLKTLILLAWMQCRSPHHPTSSEMHRHIPPQLLPSRLLPPRLLPVRSCPTMPTTCASSAVSSHSRLRPIWPIFPPSPPGSRLLQIQIPLPTPTLPPTLPRHPRPSSRPPARTSPPSSLFLPARAFPHAPPPASFQVSAVSTVGFSAPAAPPLTLPSTSVHPPAGKSCPKPSPSPP
jgi:hypothetical protein